MIFVVVALSPPSPCTANGRALLPNPRQVRSTFPPRPSDPLSRRLLLIALLNASLSRSRPRFSSSSSKAASRSRLGGPASSSSSSPPPSPRRSEPPCPQTRATARPLGGDEPLHCEFPLDLDSGPGDLIPFALICAASGAALGAAHPPPAMFCSTPRPDWHTRSRCLWPLVLCLQASLALAALTSCPP